MIPTPGPHCVRCSPGIHPDVRPYQPHRRGRTGYRPSPAVQLTTIVIGDAALSATVFTRKRWPSGETS
jgi:hypothetical protein